MDAAGYTFDCKYSKYCFLASSSCCVPQRVASVENALEYSKDFIYQVGNRCGGMPFCNSAEVGSCESQLVLMVPQTVFGLTFSVVFNVAALLWADI